MRRRFDPAAQFRNANGSTVWEAIGRAAGQNEGLSIARISLPPGADQRRRANQFDEWLIVIAGSCVVEIDGAEHELRPDDVAFIPRGAAYVERVAGAEPCVAWAICAPAYALGLVDYLDEPAG